MTILDSFRLDDRVAIVTGTAGPINSVAFSPTGHTLATGSGSGTVQVWNVRSHKRRAQLDARIGQIFSVAFSPHGRVLAAAGFNGTIRLWERVL